MCLLFETVRIDNGIPQHPEWHEERMNRCRREFWQTGDPVSLKQVIQVPDGYRTGVVKCNILYGPAVMKIIFRKYERRKIGSLKIVNGNAIDYHAKYADRAMLNSLFEMRGSCDDIIIVKNGLITDASMANLIFLDDSGWSTPATPLLKGTCRERLVASGWLSERDIRPEDLGKFTGCKLINALRYPDEESLIPVDAIF